MIAWRTSRYPLCDQTEFRRCPACIRHGVDVITVPSHQRSFSPAISPSPWRQQKAQEIVHMFEAEAKVVEHKLSRVGYMKFAEKVQVM